jgi:O-acetyl-ADP-ribose deacetylase
LAEIFGWFLSETARRRVHMPNWNSKIRLFVGDLTESDADAIVNAANNDLQLGAGVAGAIRRKGGPEIQRQCDRIGTIAIGSSAITTGGHLKARHVIHAASMRLGGRTTAEALRNSTAHAFELASQHGLRSIAFPAVGTGIAGFPMRECAEIMLGEAARHLSGQTSVERVDFVLYDQAALEVFEDVFRAMPSDSASAASS